MSSVFRGGVVRFSSVLVVLGFWFVPGCLLGFGFWLIISSFQKVVVFPKELWSAGVVLSLEYWLPSSVCGLFVGCLFLLPGCGMYFRSMLLVLWFMCGLCLGCGLVLLVCAVLSSGLFRVVAPFLCF